MRCRGDLLCRVGRRMTHSDIPHVMLVQERPESIDWHGAPPLPAPLCSLTAPPRPRWSITPLQASRGRGLGPLPLAPPVLGGLRQPGEGFLMPDPLRDLRDTPTLSDSANHELTSLHPSGPPF